MLAPQRSVLGYETGPLSASLPLIVEGLCAGPSSRHECVVDGSLVTLSVSSEGMARLCRRLDLSFLSFWGTAKWDSGARFAKKRSLA